MGLSFTSVQDSDKLAYLDLELCHKGNTIYAQKYCMSTPGNSYLHDHSCNYPKWKDNIPKSQSNTWGTIAPVNPTTKTRPPDETEI